MAIASRDPSNGAWTTPCSDPVGLVAGTLMTLFIFFALFTTLFTNLHGIETATFGTDGTLLYWLGQHDVRRGSQPWFYFITESFQYEWLAIFLSGRRAGDDRGGCSHRARQEAVPRLLFGSFLLVWFVFLFPVLSWAGEKMPWLILHFLLPGILVGGLLVDEVVLGAIAWYRRIPVHPRTRGEEIQRRTMAALVLLAFAWFLRPPAYLPMAPIRPTAIPDRFPHGPGTSGGMLAAIFPLVGLVLVGVSMVIGGVRRTAYISVTAFTIVLSALPGPRRIPALPTSTAISRSTP